VETSCLISSIGNSGARSAGPIGCPVPGCRTAGGGVLRSAAMLYHLVGMSFSDSTNFVCDLSAMADLLRRKVGPKLRALLDGGNRGSSAVRTPACDAPLTSRAG